MYSSPQIKPGELVVREVTSRRQLLALAAASAGIGLAGSGRAVRAQGADAITVNTFPGVTNLPIFVAEQKGILAKYRLAINLTFTPNSRAQRDGLEKSEYQIIQTAADNSIAMVELDNAGAAIVAGGDNGFNHIIVQPEINQLADVRGKTVVVDAPNTAFALLLYKALKVSGLGKDDYKVNPVGATGFRLAAMTDHKSNVAGIMNVPFNFRASAAGLKDLGTAYAAIGPYQSDSVVVMRDWAAAHRDTVVRYIKAVVEGRRWILDSANRAEATALIVDRLKLPPDIAAQVYSAVTDPAQGFAKDAKLDMAGLANVLKLRAELEGQWGGNPSPLDKYVDLSYYNEAMASL
jgi:ABC-type nitrate/sulfonate/bicarbonate transport system substrate-binding protein